MVAYFQGECSARAEKVEHPAHYLNNGLECIDAMAATQGKEAVMDFCLCNAFKYLWRHKSKNGIEDIKKAKWYIDKYLEMSGEAKKGDV